MAQRPRRRRPNPFPTIHPHAAGLDIGATHHVAAVAADRDPVPVRTFCTFSGDLHALAQWLHAIGITVNRNSVPNDPRPPAISSGLRIGTPALATRGFQVEDFHEIGKIVATALTGDFTDTVRAELSERTRALAERYPLYPELATSAAAV